MQKIILFTLTLLGLFLSLLQAEEEKDYAGVSIYEMRGETLVYESNRSKTLFKDINVSIALFKSKDSTITIDNIQKKDILFKPVPKEEKFQDTNITYWLKVNLGEHYPSGRFVYSYADAEFSEHSIAKHQQLEKFKLYGIHHIKFSYDKTTDAQVYYFKLIPHHYKVSFRFLYVSTLETFYIHMENELDIGFILGIILGLILMAGIYNAAMYYYNRDISFLYYALMQLFMLVILFTFSGAFLWDEGSYFSRNISFQSIISITASIFATLFTIHFLETKKYTVKLHKILTIALVVLLLDIGISIFYQSIIIRYYLLPFFMLFFLFAGYRRISQGYKPAYFYLAGWTILTIAVFLNIFEIGYSYTVIAPLYIGAAIEAILFSLALSYKMRMVAHEKEQQKEMLVHQSKLASMGEMIGNIAHQWRQPLSHLSYTFMNIQEAQKHNELDNIYLDKKISEANIQLDFMSQTIDDFKDFYAPHKAKEYFMLSSATQETLDIIQNTLKHSDIESELILIKDTQLFNYKNEYKQVLLNLISNAKDALTTRGIRSPKITIIIDTHSVNVLDNAGGIKDELLSRIYEPYFSTKERHSGIGLYMSKMIIERNMDAKLEIRNTEKGVEAKILF